MRADLSNTDLTGANLEAARASFAWFARAWLINANFQETKFVSVNFKNAVIEGSVRRFAIFPDCHFKGCTGCPKDWHADQSE